MGLTTGKIKGENGEHYFLFCLFLEDSPLSPIPPASWLFALTTSPFTLTFLLTKAAFSIYAVLQRGRIKNKNLAYDLDWMSTLILLIEIHHVPLASQPSFLVCEGTLPGKHQGLTWGFCAVGSLLHPLISCSYLIVSLENCNLLLAWTDLASAFSHENPLNLADKEPPNWQIPSPCLSTYGLIR